MRRQNIANRATLGASAAKGGTESPLTAPVRVHVRACDTELSWPFPLSPRQSFACVFGDPGSSTPAARERKAKEMQEESESDSSHNVKLGSAAPGL